VDVAHLFGCELSGRGHDIDFILQSREACDEPRVETWNGCEAWVGPTDTGGSRLRRLRRHLLDLRNDLRVFARMRARRYDLVIVKDKYLSGVPALIAARIHRTAFAYWLSYPLAEASLASARDGTARYPWLYRLRGLAMSLLLYRVLLPSAAHVFVQSEQMRRDLEDRGVPRRAMTPVPMGIRAADFAAVDEGGTRRRLPGRTPCIVYLGTLIRVRRLDFLVRTLALVRADIPDACLYLVGGGDEEADERLLRDEAARLGMPEAVRITGQLPRGEALRYVLEADVCVSPFFPTPILNSTSPTKLIEYLAMARPVVANDHPEQRLVLERSGAGHCVPYREEAFAKAIVELLRDPEAAARMGERGRRYVQAYRDYGVIAGMVERELVRIAGQGPAATLRRA
jgi:glycosyltransferase involved in cell wall biosynthesis